MPDPPADALMWEARTHPGRQRELLNWVEHSAISVLLADPTCIDVASYLGGQDRVVLIAQTTGAPPRLPDPPADLLLRSVHQWPFHSCDRRSGPAACINPSRPSEQATSCPSNADCAE